MLIYPVTIVDVLMHRVAMMVRDFENKGVLPLRLAAEAYEIRGSKNGDSEAYRRLIEAH